AFGARPGDVEQVERLGLRQYIDQQLHPEKIADPGMTERLAGLKTIALSSREISEQFEQPALLLRRQRQQAGQGQNNDQNGRPTPEVMAMQQRANGVLVELSEQKILRAAYSERQLQEVLTDFWFNHFNVDVRPDDVAPVLVQYERDVVWPH